MSRIGDLRAQMRRYRHAIGEVRRGRQPIYVEYPFEYTPRWQDKVGNPHLAAIIAAAEPTYRANIEAVRGLQPAIARLKDGGLPFSVDWRNIYLPAFDGFTVMWAARRAKSLFLEVGSGNSTIFARAALSDAAAPARIVSIDPQPRADIDRLCDEVIRAPLERVDLALFDQLQPGDTLFIDNSHQSFMNSDVTVFMLDVLPRLRPGVLVGLHDIFLPWDYPASWADRGYNEQYLLGSWMLANPASLDLQFANHWTWRQGLHQELLADLWSSFDPDIGARECSAIWAIKR